MLAREVRARMRGLRSHLITGGYALAVGSIVLGTYWYHTGNAAQGSRHMAAVWSSRSR